MPIAQNGCICTRSFCDESLRFVRTGKPDASRLISSLSGSGKKTRQSESSVQFQDCDSDPLRPGSQKRKAEYRTDSGNGKGLVGTWCVLS